MTKVPNAIYQKETGKLETEWMSNVPGEYNELAIITVYFALLEKYKSNSTVVMASTR